MSEQQSELTLIDHLTELRTRLVKSLWGCMLGVVICYNFTDKIFEIIRKPIAPYLPSGGLVFTAPSDKFIAHLKIAFFGGLILSCPIWLYQIWKFISPGLYSKEKKYSLSFIVVGSFLFMAGNLFAYFIVFPAAFQFLMGYGGGIDQPMITIDSYLSFFVMTSLMFGLSFELPLIMAILGLMGLMSSKFLRSKRRYAVMVLAVIAAVLTPPDIMSMLFMLVPMVLLYEIGLIMVMLIERKKRQSGATAGSQI